MTFRRTGSPIDPFTSYQKFVIATLAFLQFTLILDFMIMSPLGAAIMPALRISTSQFGLAVSVYAFSAGISGIVAAGFADRYDRKKMLLFFYSGFLVATLLGLPLGLYLSNLWGWHAPFLLIVIVGVLAAALISTRLEPIDGHIKLQVSHKPFQHLWATVSSRRYVFAFCASGLVSIGGFMLMPFGSAYTVGNLGIDIQSLPLIYLVTGVAAIFIGPLVGRASDRFGKFKTFAFGSAVSIVTVSIYTRLGITSLGWVMLINTVMFVGIFSRMIPSQALMTAIPEVASRGSFMAISASVQQIAGGLGSVIAGLVVSQGADGRLEHFEWLGNIMVGTVLLTLTMIYLIDRQVQSP